MVSHFFQSNLALPITWIQLVLLVAAVIHCFTRKTSWMLFLIKLMESIESINTVSFSQSKVRHFSFANRQLQSTCQTVWVFFCSEVFSSLSSLTAETSVRYTCTILHLLKCSSRPPNSWSCPKWAVCHLCFPVLPCNRCYCRIPHSPTLWAERFQGG